MKKKARSGNFSVFHGGKNDWIVRDDRSNKIVRKFSQFNHAWSEALRQTKIESLWDDRVAELEEQGCTRSDAQAVADAELGL